MRFFLKLAQSAQPRERNSKISTKSPEYRWRGHFFWKKATQWGFKAKTTC
jgi:hypothetical protein